jgi:acyl dehydratase
MQAGETLTPLICPPITRELLHAYAEASGDHNPLHTDSATAQAAGQPDVIAHGMLVMSFVGRMLRLALPDAQLQRFGVRFRAPTYLGDELICGGRIIAREGNLLQGEIWATTANGDLKLAGTFEAIL